MSLGSEQFMRAEKEAVCHVGSSSVPGSAKSSDTDSDPIEDTTVEDLHLANTIPQPALKQPSNGLMSLLSGSQTAKTKKKKTTKKRTQIDAEEKNNPLEDPSASFTDSKTVSISESSDVPDTSFDVLEFERKAEKSKAIEDLEKKIYSAGKSVSVSDFLRKKKAPETKVAPDIKVDEVIPNPPSSPEIIAVDDENEVIEITEEDPLNVAASNDLEILYPNSRSVNARNLFDAFAPKPMKKANGEWSLKVRLRISPDKLAAIKKFENPLTTRGNHDSGGSMLSALMNTKTTRDTSKVLPSNQHTESSVSGKKGNAAFAMMMKSASQNANPKLSAIQKLKELHPPHISRELMHVLPEGEYAHVKPSRTLVKSVSKDDIDISGESMVELGTESLSAFKEQAQSPPKLRYTSIDNYSEEALVKKNAPLAFTSMPHMAVLSNFIHNKVPKTNHANWPQKFQPKNIKTLLIQKECRQFLKKWMSNAFSVLETQSTKTPRNVKLKELQKKQKRRDASMQNFIVDDFDEDEELTDEDVFVPILVIQGEHGSCKTASIYAAMAAMDGYVHEINTGQARSRKDLHSSLREFCTTQIIHKNHDEKKFQKGLVLFEDCDILFEQDKTFWTTVQDVINYSRRPIVVTVRDLGAVPNNILELAEEQNSILNFKVPPTCETKQYLWLCAYSFGVSLAPEVLDQVVSESQTNKSVDLRKALMTCQWLCRIPHTSSGICNISHEPTSKSFAAPAQDLEHVVAKLDAVSVSDVLETNTHSQILHDVQVNELIDIYVIDDSLHLRQRTLPHELNTGTSIRELFNHEEEPSQDALTFNDIHGRILEFLASRAKKLPKFIQDLYGMRVQTRSRSTENFVEERPETQGLPETSVCYSMSSQGIIQDLAPIARYWASFQKGIIALDNESRKDSRTQGIQNFLGWRKFYDGVEEVLATGPIYGDE
ncbi:hypothetical protein OXX59_001324 [Metschnikowia pulcherrima]